MFQRNQTSQKRATRTSVVRLLRRFFRLFSKCILQSRPHARDVGAMASSFAARRTEKVDALFIFIGSFPNSALVHDLVECDDTGFVLTGLDLPHVKGRIKGWSLDRDPFHLETSVPGLFAVGDVRWGSSKRVAAAVGEGSVAVSLVHQYLSTV